MVWFRIFRVIKQVILLIKMESQGPVSSTVEEQKLRTSPISNEDNACISYNNLCLPSFDAQHINCLLLPRRKEETKFISRNTQFQASSSNNEKETYSVLQPTRDEAMGADDDDDSLIFRPKNKRKEQQDACLHETPIKMDKREKLLSFNPERVKRQPFKILTRRSQEYEPMIEWMQSQNPANMTLPS